MSLLSVPLKTILMYHADNTGESIPASYQVCDGTTLGIGTHDIGGGAASYTVPDLRNKFVLGADITKGVGNAGDTSNTSGGAPGPKGTGGSHNKTLAIGELPAHTHTGSTASNGAHVHSGSTADSGGAHIHSASESTAGAHTHAGSSADTGGAHSHTITDPGHALMGEYCANPGYNGRPNYITGGNPGSDGGIRDQLGELQTTGITVNSGGTHSHTLTLASDGTHSHTITVASGGAHTHTLTLVSDGAHTHTFTSDATGSGTNFDTRPRYYGVVFIMKVRN